MINPMGRRVTTVALAASFALLLAACSSSSPSSIATPTATTGSVLVNGFSISADPKIAALLPAKYKSEISIVTSAPYPPFEVFDKNQKLTGLDIDLGDMIAARLGSHAKWTSIDYNGVIPALQAGKYDMVLASIGDTTEREKALDFVNYSKQGQILVVKKGNPEGITGLESMCGKVLSVEAGNIPKGYFASLTKKCTSLGKNDMTMKELPKTSDAILSVKSGSSSAIYLGVATAADLLTKPEGADFQIVAPAGKPFGYIPRYVGAGIPKATPQLRDAVRAALESLLADGTLKQLYTKYGQAIILTDKITVNNVVEIPLL
jgi:polar amino acid transport system substrate-binding protein